MGDYMPGVPAMGHLSTGGFWHSGKSDVCEKCHPTPPLRWCQVCQIQGVRREAMWDVKTKDGPWADVCTQHLMTHGVENPRLRNKIGGGE
jgi:hypothetical protein